MSTSTEGKTPSNGPQSDDNKRTIIFVGVAVACLAITGILDWANRPARIKEYGKLGKEFYPDFTDPTVATSLSVKVINADNLKPLEFSVKQANNGRWVIPSHHNYPADAADQLAQTASSVIGIKREAMVTRWPSDHARYGVVDPETDSVTVDEMEGIGKRLTFRGKDDEVLASFIIGKQEEGKENRFYVRHPAEDETYIAELSIDLSTKFGDWVKTDLLDIQGSDILKVDLQDYSFEERGMSLAVTNTIETKLTRPTSAEDWKMEGLDETTKQVNTEAISATVNTLADLAIAGVRPKQPGLTGELELDRSVVANQRDVDRLQNDLMSRGFLLQPSKSNPEELRLIAREGELAVGTADGLSYQLHFGRAFAGSDEELEIGFSTGASSKDDTTEESDNEADEDSDAEGSEEPETESSDEESDGNTKPGRYVFVRVKVDPTLLGDKPNPVPPQKSEELIEAEKKAAEAAATDTGESSENPKEEPTPTENAASGEESTEEDATVDSAEDSSEASAESTDDGEPSQESESPEEANTEEANTEEASSEEATGEEATGEEVTGDEDASEEAGNESSESGEASTEDADAEEAVADANADTSEGEGEAIQEGAATQENESEAATEDDESETSESTDEAAGEEASTQTPAEADEPKEDDPAAEAAKLQGMKDAYAAALKQYADDVEALEAYEQKIKVAEEKAVELNRRFAQWYYVIPGEDYDKLSLKQEDLVAAKETEDGTPVDEPTPGLKLNIPSANDPGLPMLTPPGGN